MRETIGSKRNVC